MPLIVIILTRFWGDWLIMFSGKDLKEFRDSREWSLRQFSVVVGVSVKTLQVIEKEDKPVPLQLRLALAAIKAGVYPIDD